MSEIIKAALNKDKVLKIFGRKIPKRLINSPDRYSSDQPDKNFTGPF